MTKCARKNLKKAKSLAMQTAMRRAMQTLKVVHNSDLNHGAINAVVVVKVVAVKIAVVVVAAKVAVKIVRSLLNRSVRRWRPRVVQMAWRQSKASLLKARRRLIQTIQHQKPQIQMEVRAVVAVAVAVVVVAAVKWMARLIKMVAIQLEIQATIRMVNPMANRVHPKTLRRMAKAKIIPISRTIPTRQQVMNLAVAVDDVAAVVKAEVVVEIKDQTANQLFIQTRRNAQRRNKA